MMKPDTLYVKNSSDIQESIQIYLKGENRHLEKVGTINFIPHAISDPICEDGVKSIYG